jgi:hypothetical protein
VIEKLIREGVRNEELVRSLFHEKDIVHVVLENIKRFKENVRQRIATAEHGNEATLDEVVQQLLGVATTSTSGKRPKTGYQEQITGRISLLVLIFSRLGEATISYELISSLWHEIVVNGLSQGERDLVYRWLGEIASGSGKTQMTKEDLYKFFSREMCDD